MTIHSTSPTMGRILRTVNLRAPQTRGCVALRGVQHTRPSWEWQPTRPVTPSCRAFQSASVPTNIRNAPVPEVPSSTSGPPDIQQQSLIDDPIASITVSATPSHSVIDNPTDLAAMLDSLHGLETDPPSLYVDLEGINLCRFGSISILQLHAAPLHTTYLIDIHALGHDAFSARGANGLTFKDLLESADIPKVFFDVRNDADGLFNLFQVQLGGVYDLQLMELATRKGSHGGRLNGLSRCIQRDAPMTPDQLVAWQFAKDKGRDLFVPGRGGGWDVFNRRPLAEDIVRYCVQDVQVLPSLWAVYMRNLTPAGMVRVRDESDGRVAWATAVEYRGGGSHMSLVPAGWRTK
ncbi:exonuclease [Podospora appendiculata]|uniref:Exonuclease n=1 Tax=Podospora appendiculata TaxID=314037 RepID=A0AAE0X8P9_9PEZI|nr:exonuclease [Podospora appendiculata]